MEVPFSPLIDRGDNGNMAEEESGAIAESGSMTPPRVGGVDDGVPWVGGSFIDRSSEPQDVLCHRPKSFKEKQKQHSDLKRGLDDCNKLDFVDGTKTTVGLTMWITWMTMMIVQKGFDTVYKILIDNDRKELDLLKNWGKATKEQVKDWVKRLQDRLGDKFDKENLKLSAHAVRNSIGPTLLARVISLTGAEATGPELFVTAVQQVNFMTASLVRSVCTKMVNLKLKLIPGKNVGKLVESISDLVKQI